MYRGYDSVVIPVPDTDCQGLENQFLRRGGWQVASREQSMLKKREISSKMLHMSSHFYIYYVCVTTKSNWTNQNPQNLPSVVYLIWSVLYKEPHEKMPYIMSFSITSMTCVTPKWLRWCCTCVKVDQNALWIRWFCLNNDPHHWLWSCDMIQSRSIIWDSAVERTGNILSCFLHLLIQLAWLMDGTESTGPFRLTKPSSKKHLCLWGFLMESQLIDFWKINSWKILVY